MRIAGPSSEWGVSPVIGTVLILAISVVGMASVLFWGAPILDDLQQRNAQTSVVAEFLEIRDGTTRLTGADASRNLGINLPGGTVAYKAGGQMVVATSRETGCTVDLDGWTDGGTDVTFVATGTCTTPDPVSPACTNCAQVYKLNGSTLDTVAVTLVVTAGSSHTITVGEAIDITANDWLVRVVDATGVTMYDAWILHTDVLEWERQGQTGERGVHFSWGSVLSERQGALFVEGQYAVTENAFQNDDYFMRVTTLNGSHRAINGIGDHGFFVSLASFAGHIQNADVYDIRHEWTGSLAENWCNTMEARNVDLSGSPYSACALEGDETAWATTYTPASTPIKMEFIHATIQADLRT